MIQEGEVSLRGKLRPNSPFDSLFVFHFIQTKKSSSKARFLVNSWGEIWKTFEDIDARLVELGIDQIRQDD